MQSRFTKYLSVFTPSALGIIFYVTLTGLAVAISQVDGIKSFLHFSKNVDVMRIVARWSDHTLTHLIGTARTDTLVVGSFWAVVGLLVYLFLRGLARFVAELDDDIAVRKYIWPKGADRSKPLTVIAERSAFRIAVLIVLAFVLVGPMAALVQGPIWKVFLGPNEILQIIVWVVVSLIMWHVIVILLRLLALRPRLMG